MKQRIKTFFAGGLLALNSFAVAVAGPLEDGDAAYHIHDYATAMRLWRSLAEQGNAAAQFKLGTMYEFGQGVPIDYAQAVVWIRKAADAGYASAQDNLGLMYHFGQGVPLDDARAVLWWLKAAGQGDAPGLFSSADFEGRLGIPGGENV